MNIRTMYYTDYKKISRTFLLLVGMVVALIPGVGAAQTTTTSQGTGLNPRIILGEASMSDTKNVSIPVAFSQTGYSDSLGSLPVYQTILTNIQTGENIGSYTKTAYYDGDNHVFQFPVVAGTSYSYRAEMSYKGQRFVTETKNFSVTNRSTIVAGSQTIPTTSSSSSTGTSSNTSSTSTSSGGSSVISVLPTVKSSTTSSSSSTTTTSSSMLGLTKVANNLESIIKTGGYGNKNGVALAITNSHARVVDDALFDYTIRYHNANAKTLKTARIVVQLPDQYAFENGDGNTVYSNDSNVVTLYLGTIEPKESGEVIFRARALGGENQRTQTKATLYYTGGSVSATDTDSYVGGSKSVLGATVFGTGFFPSTFFGWLLIIIILVIITIVVRRYLKKREL